MKLRLFSQRVSPRPAREDARPTKIAHYQKGKGIDAWNHTCYVGAVNYHLNLLLAKALLLISAADGF
jgi:hypothetical protein